MTGGRSTNQDFTRSNGSRQQSAKSTASYGSTSAPTQPTSAPPPKPPALSKPAHNAHLTYILNSLSSSKAEQLKKDFKFLEKNTDFSEAELISWYSNFKKDCPDGRLTKDKFRLLYEALYPTNDSGSLRRLSGHLFRTFDDDRNGFVDFREFIMSLSALSRGKPRERLGFVFRLYDVDNNGSIELEELREIVQCMAGVTGRQWKSRQIEQTCLRVMHAADLNGDGKLSKQEFVDACRRDPDLETLMTAFVALE